MRLILVRHGQTPHNITGALDTARPGAALTALGEAQAAAVPAALAAAGIRPAAVFASPLRRTQQTAAPLAAALGIELRVGEGFEEISAGDLELRDDPEAITAYLDCVYAWSDGDLEHRLPGAPDGHAFLARYDAAVRAAVAAVQTEAALRTGATSRTGQGPYDEVAYDEAARDEVARDKDLTIVVVSHGAAIRMWTTARAANVEPGYARGHRLSNTGAATFVGHPDSGWILTDWHPEALGGPGLASRGVHDVTGNAQDDPEADEAVVPA